MSLATLATLYGRSAGGTAYRLKDARHKTTNALLPANAGGRQWFRYVRITNNEPEIYEHDGAAEIDAVAAVYPDSAWEFWRKENYDWTQLANPAVSGKAAPSPNGNPNYLNFAIGAAKTQAGADLKISAFEIKNGRLEFSFPVWDENWNWKDLAESGVGVAFQAKGDLTAPWPSGPVSPAAFPVRFEKFISSPGGGESTVSFPNLQGIDNAFFRLMVTSGE